MDSLYTIIKLLAPNCFMASIDLKDAYYSVPIKASDRKLVSFKWKEQIYQFTCLPNGLSCAPRKFTKILKPVLAHLHTKGHISVAHLDDLLLTTAQHGQTICSFDVNYVQEFEDKYRIMVMQKLKSSKPGVHLEPMNCNPLRRTKNFECLSTLMSISAGQGISEMDNPNC